MSEKSLLKPLGRSLLIIPIAVLVYAIILHHVFVTLIQPTFAYTGYQYTEAPVEVTIVSGLVAIAVALALPRVPKRPSSVILWILYVVVVCPAILTLPYMGPMGPWVAVLFGLGIGASLVAAALVTFRREGVLKAFRGVSPTTFWLLITAFTALTYVYIAFTTGLQLSYLSLNDVYDQREDYHEALAASSLLGYLVSTQANVVNPIVLARLIQKRQWGWVPFIVAAQLLLYTATGFRSVLLSIIAIPLMILLFKQARPRMITLMWGAAGLLLICWVIDTAGNSITLSSLFGRRFLYTPARLSGLYFEWFSNNPLAMLGNSVLRPFIDSPYEYSPARTISLWVTGSPAQSMNANVFAAGFAEFGWVGLLGVGVLLGIYLRLLDKAASGLPIWLVAAVVVMPSITLSNTALHTAMLSHGLLALMVLLAIMPRTPDESHASDTSPDQAQARTDEGESRDDPHLTAAVRG